MILLVVILLLLLTREQNLEAVTQSRHVSVQIVV